MTRLEEVMTRLVGSMVVKPESIFPISGLRERNKVGMTLHRSLGGN